MSDRGAIRTWQKLNGVLGQSLSDQRRTQGRHQCFVGLDRRRRTTKQRSISRLECQTERVHGHVGTSLVHHADDAERNTLLAQLQTVRQSGAAKNFADRIG